MKTNRIEINGKPFTEIVSDEVLIANARDTTDLIVNAETESIIFYKHNLHPDFFELRTGFAGQGMPKFMYAETVVILGDYSTDTSKALRDFIYESNQNGKVLFVDSLTAAQAILNKYN